MPRVVLIEDQVMFRASLAALLRAELKADVVGEYGSGDAFMEARDALGEIDLILLDIQLPGDNGLTLAAQFRKTLPNTKIILLSSIREDYILHKALQLDVEGFVHKDDSPDTLAAAIKVVMDGGCFFGQTIQQLRRKIGNNAAAFSKILSPKEQQVLELLGQGLSNEEAAPLLALSAETVQTHRRNIMRKLRLHSASELQAYALKNGFTQVSDLR